MVYFLSFVVFVLPLCQRGKVRQGKRMTSFFINLD